MSIAVVIPFRCLQGRESNSTISFRGDMVLKCVCVPREQIKMTIVGISKTCGLGSPSAPQNTLIGRLFFLLKLQEDRLFFLSEFVCLRLLTCKSLLDSIMRFIGVIFSHVFDTLQSIHNIHLD